MKIGECELYLGDCRELIDGIGEVDAVITDPPYDPIYTHGKHLSGTVNRKELNFSGLNGEELSIMAAKWVKISRGWCVFTCDWHHMIEFEKLGILIRFGIWRKLGSAPQFTGDRPGTGWEAVAVLHKEGKKNWNGGGKHGIWEYAIERGEHPSQKPLALYSKFISDFTNIGDTVFDPFMGSGTTGVACVKSGRKFIGIESDPIYFELARKRIEAAERQPSLFHSMKQQELIIPAGVR